ncbi:hypothetical protein HELRODRAFT_157973 [Helobdella robusta]|uniref:Eukaryotic translation initiation factor 3 subunit B n=1 Tax=Helobdella robusta TaxID=6412 RepID=T1EMI4_HELRO|nr:hypothetical protein HELRODRAFT_157973 [Helobdella robusta]ESN92191.1 hypothetical protein HELRODRAFT_157973 [Helobdella robusta]
MTKQQKEKTREKIKDGQTDDEEPNFSDPDDFVEKVSDQEILGDLLKQRPKETDGIDNFIIVDNVPQVGPERLEKLQNIIKKIYTKFGKIVTEHYPMDNGMTKGFIFLEFQTHQEALKAVAATDGYKLDKQHVFAVNMFSDIEKYTTNVSEKWEEPVAIPYKDHGNLYSWLLNPHCYDQFSVIYEGGETTALYLNTPSEPQCLEMRKRWTETFVKWSPKGTYLLTYHQKGIALWGGEKMGQVMKFSHPGVQMSDFSPCERYLVTYSSLADTKDEPQAIIVWDIRTGQKKRAFHCDSPTPWPIFKWSFDGRYFARMSTDTLSIYETPSFGLLEKKSVKIKGLRDFSWSPTDSILAYWTSEERDTPARVTLVDVPSYNTLCAKNLFTVADCRMHWQKSGAYLCVKVDRYKSKKEEKETVKYQGIFHNFNIFRIREKEIPVDTVDVKDTISAFAWEPIGSKFCIIHGDAPRTAVSFYNVKPMGVVECIKTFEKKSVNHLFWSPNGQFIVLAGLRSMNGVLEFVDTQDMTVMTQAEHFMATDVEWDPTGRYVATGVSWWGHKVDNAFWIWNFQGKILHKQTIDRYCQLLWRPRPPSLLSGEQIKDLKKNMKKYNIQFSIEDKKRETKASKEQIDKRNKQLSEFNLWRSKCVEKFEDEKKRRLQLRRDIDTDELDSHVENFEEETVEFLLEVEEILIDEE